MSPGHCPHCLDPAPTTVSSSAAFTQLVGAVGGLATAVAQARSAVRRSGAPLPAPPCLHRCRHPARIPGDIRGSDGWCGSCASVAATSRTWIVVAQRDLLAMRSDGGVSQERVVGPGFPPAPRQLVAGVVFTPHPTSTCRKGRACRRLPQWSSQAAASASCSSKRSRPGRRCGLGSAPSPSTRRPADRSQSCPPGAAPGTRVVTLGAARSARTRTPESEHLLRQLIIHEGVKGPPATRPLG